MSFSLPSTSGGGGGGSSEGLFSPGASGSGGLKPPGGAFGFAGAHGPSPLATSPPVMPMDEDEDEEVPATPSGAPKIKLKLGKKA